jgi:chemotaxis protein CheX
MLRFGPLRFLAGQPSLSVPFSMPAVDTSITEALIGEHLTRAVTAVFKIMLGRSIVPEGAERAAENATGVQVIVGQVGLVGQVNGFAYLHIEDAFAKECAASMLGLDARELATLGSDAVKDAIGELANMTAGSFKNGLCDIGLPCKLTLPSVLRACDFTVVASPRWAHRYHYRFDSHGHRVVVDVLMKVE